MIFSAIRNSNGIDYIVRIDTEKDPHFKGVTDIETCRQRAIEQEAGMANTREWRIGDFGVECLWQEECHNRRYLYLAWCEHHLEQVSEELWPI